MVKKMLRLFLMGTTVLLASCIDETYDLANKELVTDVKIEGNKLALPLGSMQAFVLDSLIDVEAIPLLEQMNGVYCINMSDTVSYEITIPSISFSIPPQKVSELVEFDEAEITEVDIEGVTTEAVLESPEISIDDLNATLPKLSSSVTTSLVSDDMEALLEIVKQLGGSNTQKYQFQSESFRQQDHVACQMSYELPKQIKTLSSIKLANRAEGSNASSGSLVQFEVVHPEVLSEVSKTISFTIEFPNSFRLSLDKSVKEFSKYHLVNDYTLEVNGIAATSNVTSISFYIDELAGLEQYVDEQVGTLRMDEFISYSVEYTLNGEVTLSKDTDPDDFEFTVDMSVPLWFSDIACETNELDVAFEPMEMDFNVHFDDLTFIDRIDSVVFDPQHSKLIFETNLDGGFQPFKLKEGHALKFSFPKEFIIDEQLSNYPTKGTSQPLIHYDDATHSFYIYDLDVLVQSHWELALDRIVVNKDLEDNGVLNYDIVASISAVDKQLHEMDGLSFGNASIASLNQVLESLKDKRITFGMKKSHLSIDDAVLHTNKISAPFDTNIDFEINEEVPKELGRIERVGFAEAVPVTFGLDIHGVEKLDVDVHLDLYLSYPSCLNLVSNDSRVTVEDDSLVLKLDYNPTKEKVLSLQLSCVGLDFTSDEFGTSGLVITDSLDGKSYLSYKDKIALHGHVYVNEADFHSQAMENIHNIVADLSVNIGDIEVRNFDGLYRGEIAQIEESIALDFDLGEELAFLLDEKNGVTLAEPQLLIAVENTVGVPIDVQLQLWGRDENGNVVESTVIEELFHVEPADYIEESGEIVPRKTKLLITSDTTNVSREGCQNVQIPNLARLLENGLPASVELFVLPVIRTDATHHVDLSHKLRFSGEYEVLVPLKFKDLYICYSDTLSNIQVDLGDVMDMFSNMSVTVSMDVENTIPIDLSLDVTPLDEDNRILSDLEIDPLRISAGDGGDITQPSEHELVSFSIRSATGDLSSLDKLAFTIDASVSNATNGVALKGDQGVHITNVVLEVCGDIETNLKKK